MARRKRGEGSATLFGVASQALGALGRKNEIKGRIGSFLVRVFLFSFVGVDLL